MHNGNMVQAHRLERGNGDGSRDAIQDISDNDEFQDKDERAPTRTTFYDRDIDQLEISYKRKQRLKRMLRRQEGENPGEAYYQGRQDRTQQNRSEWKRRVVSTFASQLDLTRAQKERVKHLINDVLDINTFGYYSTEQVVLGTVNVVAREDNRWIEDEQQFRTLMVESELSDDGAPDMGAMKTLRQMVRERLPNN